MIDSAFLASLNPAQQQKYRKFMTGHAAACVKNQQCADERLLALPHHRRIALHDLMAHEAELLEAVAPEVIEHSRGLTVRAAEDRAAWQQRFDAWALANPERLALLERLEAGELPEGARRSLPVFEAGTSVATRAAKPEPDTPAAPLEVRSMIRIIDRICIWVSEISIACARNTADSVR